MRRRHILRYGSATVALTALTLFAGWWQVDGPATPSSPGPFPLPLAEMTFKLVDHEGQSVGPQSLVGRPTMVFFGFTYCPDVCPTTLSDITSWLDALGEVDPRITSCGDLPRCFARVRQQLAAAVVVLIGQE